MHLAYSAIAENSSTNKQSESNTCDEISLRYNAYLAACNKYKDEIAAIRKYFPGWAPSFR